MTQPYCSFANRAEPSPSSLAQHSLSTSLYRPLSKAAVLAAILFVLSASIFAQSAKPHTADAEKSATASKMVLPSEDTVNSFLFQTFGYDLGISWKIVDIRPSEIEGLAEVNVNISGPQGTTPNKLLVSSDGKHMVSGEILPFGAKPFEEARLARLPACAMRSCNGWTGRKSGWMTASSRLRRARPRRRAVAWCRFRTI